MTDNDWSYDISKKYWYNKNELRIESTEMVKDIKVVANLLKTFLEKEELPFKVLGEIELLYSDKSADSNLSEHWGRAYILIPVLKRRIFRKPCGEKWVWQYNKLEGKHFIKVRISLNESNFGTWQEYHDSKHRWYIEMEQIKTWKELLEKFSNSLPTLKSNSDIGNPSIR